MGDGRTKTTTMTLESPAFQEGQPIPQKYAYEPEGQNISPPLKWEGAPEGTSSLALIVDDPDAPRDEPWVHWVVYGIPATARGLPEDEVGAAKVGANTWEELGWGGPLPPERHGPHRYVFTLYALDREPALEPGATKGELLSAMRGHVLGEARLVGTYER